MSEMKMLDLYENVLNSLSHEVTDKGLVNTRESDGVALPIEVDGKRLAIPMPDLMASGDASLIMFHPLKEDIGRGPSHVMEWLRGVASDEMSGEFAASVYTYLGTAASTDVQKTFAPEQSELFDTCTGAKTSAVKAFHAMIPKAKKKGLQFVKIYLKRGGKDPKTGEIYRWLATVTFPFYEAFVKDPASITGTAPSKPDIKSIKEAIEFLYPGIATDQQFSYGSNSVQAPKFDAVLGAIKNLRSQIFAVAEILNGTQYFIEHTSPTMDWAKYVGNLEHFKREVMFVPMQAGNEGSVDSIDNEGVKGEAVKRQERPEIKEQVESGNSVRAERTSVEEESTFRSNPGRSSYSDRRDREYRDDRDSRDRDDRRRDDRRDDDRGSRDRRDSRDDRRDSGRDRDDRRSGRGGNPNSLSNVVSEFSHDDRDRDDGDRDSRYRNYRNERDRDSRDRGRGGYGYGRRR